MKGMPKCGKSDYYGKNRKKIESRPLRLLMWEDNCGARENGVYED